VFADGPCERPQIHPIDVSSEWRPLRRRGAGRPGPAVEAVVEVPVALGRLLEVQLLGHDPARRDPVVGDQVAQLTVVRLDVGLPGADRLALREQGTEREHGIARGVDGVGPLGVLGHEQSDDPDPPGRADAVDQRLDGGVRLLRAVGVVGLETDRLDAAVDAAAVGGVHDEVRRGDRAEVDRGRTDLLGEGEPVRFAVHDEHLRGPLHHRRQRCHQTHRTGAHHQAGVARLQAGQPGPVPAGREDVGQHRVVQFVLGPLRQSQRVPVGPRHPQRLGLAAGVRPHVGIAVGATREPGVDLGAEAGVAGLAVPAVPAADVERQHDPVALLQTADAGTDLLHHAHVLVAQGLPGLDRGPALVHVEVRPADVGRRDADDGVVRVHDRGVGDVGDGDVRRAVVDERAHEVLPVVCRPPPRAVVLGSRCAGAGTAPVVPGDVRGTVPDPHPRSTSGLG